MPSVKATALYLIAFFSLHMLMMECHEQVHLLTGYLICGCYGERNFNVWSLCETCSHPGLSWLVSLSGPVFTYGMVWLGLWWFTKGEDDKLRWQGFALLFANLPFARVFTSLTNRGDEKTAFMTLLGPQSTPHLPHLLAVTVTLICCFLPIILLYRKLRLPYKGLIVTGFVILPMIAGMFYSHRFLNGLLANGWLSQTHILGTPDAVILHAGIMLLLYVNTRRSLKQPPFSM